MKKLFGLLTILFLSVSAFAQKSGNNADLYPEKYTLSGAEAFQKKGEYGKAAWFYINLYPDNKALVIQLVKKLATKLDTVEMPVLIKRSFVQYGTLDPTLITFDGEAPAVDVVKLKQKGAWADELIDQIGDPTKALSTAEEYNLRALNKTKKGKLAEAIADFDIAIAMAPTGQFYFNRGYAKSLAENFEAAILDYDKTISLKYRMADAYFERGFCNDQSKAYAEAIEDYTKAIEQKKDYAEAYNNRAFVKTKQKNYKEAIQDFDKAIRIKPDFAGAYMNRGFAKNEAGDKSAACSDWKKAVELGLEQASGYIKKNCE
ncbi:MAG TPA: tetratricopeptide repeat protein [Bacteroidia bacterium]|jgi:tetratricopeptide (TPR) repeat protein